MKKIVIRIQDVDFTGNKSIPNAETLANELFKIATAVCIEGENKDYCESEKVDLIKHIQELLNK